MAGSTILRAADAPAPKASPTPTPSVSPPAVKSWCEHLAKELKSVSLERCLQRSWKIEGQSVQGKPIPVFTFGQPEKGGDENPLRKVLIVGAIHGDEITAVSTVFRWIELLERAKKGSDILKHEYLFLPLANPDGFYANPRTRTNANGIDLNRNFATKEWKEKAVLYWKRKAGADPRRNPGKEPGSEPETKLVSKLVEDFDPDLIISVHAPYSLVDHDGPIFFPHMKSPLPVKALGAYPGSLGTFAGLEREIPVVTPELPNAKQLPDLKAIEQLFEFIMKSEF